MAWNQVRVPPPCLRGHLVGYRRNNYACALQGVSGATDQDRRRTNFWECKVHGRTAICFGLFLRSPGINVSRFNTVDRGRWIDRVTGRILGRVMPRDARLRQPGETHTESKKRASLGFTCNT